MTFLFFRNEYVVHQWEVLIFNDNRVEEPDLAQP